MIYFLKNIYFDVFAWVCIIFLPPSYRPSANQRVFPPESSEISVTSCWHEEMKKWSISVSQTGSQCKKRKQQKNRFLSYWHFRKTVKTFSVHFPTKWRFFPFLLDHMCLVSAFQLAGREIDLRAEKQTISLLE